VIAEAQSSRRYRRVLGMRNGVEGALEGQLVELADLGPEILHRLAHTPSAALGSCRYKLGPGDAERLVELCQREGADTFIYIGGNDSAATSRQVAHAAQSAGLELRVVGVPKTIDNDLPATDHCPGYGSAARFVAQTTREAGLDTWAMRASAPIKLVEVMGRYAGWLPGAGWLAKEHAEDAPHLVYVPERSVAVERMIADVGEVYRRLGWCVAVLCENQPEPGGTVIGSTGEPRWVDSFGHPYHDSPAQYLARRLAVELRVRVRYDMPGTIQRMSTAYASPVDRAEAELVGRGAVQYALDGRSGVMVTLCREPVEGYAVTIGAVDLAVVANQERPLPAGFVNPAGNGMTPAFEEYARPLIGGPLPSFQRL
jgi:ATP-dependent phosphofructokinase / diphosphate-dependent phosphofructokinase